MNSNNSNPIQRQSSSSSIRLLQILECLAKSRTPMRLQDIGKQVGMTQSTVLRYLYALQSARYVYQEEDSSRYALTWRICSMSETLNTQFGLRTIASPIVNRLSNQLALGVCLVEEEGGMCTYLDCVDGPSSVTPQRIGKRAPLYTTGSGKLFLSQYSPQQFAQYVKSADLVKRTENTITDPDLLAAALERVREQGFATDDEEEEANCRCISFPLRDYTGRIIAALSVFGIRESMTDEQIHRVIRPALEEASALISSRLGYNPLSE